MRYRLAEKDKPIVKVLLTERVTVTPDGCWIPLLSLPRMTYRGLYISMRKLARWIYLDEPIRKEVAFYATCDTQDCCNPNHLVAYVPGETASRPPQSLNCRRDKVEVRGLPDMDRYTDPPRATRADLCDHPGPQRLDPPGTFPMRAVCHACRANLVKAEPGAPWTVIVSNGARQLPIFKPKFQVLAEEKRARVEGVADACD